MTSADHSYYLSSGRGPFRVPSKRLDKLSQQELAMLEKYGHWLKALATGLLKPETEEQARFVLVTKRKEEPRSSFEWAWVKAFPTFQRKPWDGRLLSALDGDTSAGELGQPRRFDSYEKNTGESWSDRTADWQDYSE